MKSDTKSTDFVFLGDRSMSSSLSASQLHTVNMRDPLNRVLGLCFSAEHLVPLDRLNDMLSSLYRSTITAQPLTSHAYKQILVSFFFFFFLCSKSVPVDFLSVGV